MTEVVERADSTLADVRQSAEDFDRFQKELTPYKQMLDLWVSQYFGNDPARDFMTLYGTDVLPALRGEKQVGEPHQGAIQRARELWRARRFFHWDLEFPEVFVDLRRRDWAENPGFDAVVGNPPYGLIDPLPWLANLYNDAFVYFWQRGIAISKSGGLLALITPAAWLTGLNYQQLRARLLDGTQIISIVGLPYNVFGDAYIDTCVTVVKVGASTTGSVQVKQMGKRDDATQVDTLEMDTLDARAWQDDPYKKFVLIPAVARLQRFYASLQFVKLGDLIRVERGVQPYSRSKHTKEQIEADFLRLSGTPSSDLLDVYFPELLGEELSRYRIEPAKQTWLKYSDELASKRDIEFFTQSRVVLRRLLSRRRELMAAVTDEKLITTDNILNILVTADGVGENYIAALLNSKLLAWLYTNTSTISVKDDFPQVTYEELKSLPVPRIAFTTPPDERARLVGTGITEATEWIERTEKPASVSSYSFSGSLLGRWLDARLIADPEQADAVHDLLAHLAEAMITLNKDKQAETRGFLAWLAREIGAPLDDLTHKTRLQRYLGDYQKGEAHLTLDELLDILRGNRRRLQVDPSARAFQERLEQEYAASLGELLPLKARLAATDRLIDLIVYRLYGLTEEEVATVEHKGG